MSRFDFKKNEEPTKGGLNGIIESMAINARHVVTIHFEKATSGRLLRKKYRNIDFSQGRTLQAFNDRQHRHAFDKRRQLLNEVKPLRHVNSLAQRANRQEILTRKWTRVEHAGSVIA